MGARKSSQDASGSPAVSTQEAFPEQVARGDEVGVPLQRSSEEEPQHGAKDAVTGLARSARTTTATTAQRASRRPAPVAIAATATTAGVAWLRWRNARRARRRTGMARVLPAVAALVAARRATGRGKNRRRSTATPRKRQQRSLWPIAH